MSADAADSTTPPTAGPDARSFDRFAGVVLDDGRCIVYDRDSQDAWLQSSDAVDLAEWL